MQIFLERIYRLLLFLYPSEHRRQYSELMLQSFRDLYRETRRQHGILGLCGLWLRIVADTFISAFKEHRDAWKQQAGADYRTYSKIHAFMVFLPIIAIIGYTSIAHEHRDLAIIYLLILLAGITAWGLSRLGVLPTSPLWNTYVVGIFLGIVSLAVMFFSSLPAFGVYRLGLPAVTIPIISLSVYAAGIAITGRLTGSLRRSYRTVAVLLVLTTIAGFLVNSQRNAEPISQFLSLNYSLMQALAALATAAISIWFIRRWGYIGLIALMVALGVQFIWVDPAYFTGGAGQWIDLVVLLFPAVVCPLWWLLVKNRASRMRGTFVLWAILIGVIALAPSIARAMLAYRYSGYEELPGIWIYRALSALPYFAALWLALRAAESNRDSSSNQLIIPVIEGGIQDEAKKITET